MSKWAGWVCWVVAVTGCDEASVRRADDDVHVQQAPQRAVDAGTSPAVPAPRIPGRGDPGCARAEVAEGADVALYDALRAELAKLPTAARRQEAVARFLDQVRAQGGTPLSSPGGERVVFLATGAPAGGFRVSGDWSGWRPDGQVLTRVQDTDLYAYERTLPRTGPYAYKLVDGDRYFEDLLARHVVWDGIDRGGVGEFNAVVYPRLTPTDAGRLVAWRGVPSTALGGARDVFIYLPAAYDRPECPSLPTLYVHDGNESLTRAPFTHTAEALFQQKPERSALLVFIGLQSPDARFDEYTFGARGAKGPAHLTFLRDELLPAVERAFRTCAQPRDRGLSGASLGGLISSYGALELPDLFGYVGSQSGSYFWGNGAITQRVSNGPKLPVRFYLDHGCPEDNCESNRALARALEAKGYAVRHVEEPNGKHDWPFWQKRFPGVLEFFREGRTGCEP